MRVESVKRGQIGRFCVVRGVIWPHSVYRLNLSEVVERGGVQYVACLTFSQKQTMFACCIVFLWANLVRGRAFALTDMLSDDHS